MDAELLDIIPHRPPTVLIDRLIRWDGESAVASRTFTAGDWGTDAGAVLEAALIECLAQTAAAMHGRMARDAGRPMGQGMLVGINDFHFHAPVRCGQALELLVRITRRIGPFCFIAGEVRHEGRTVAEGELKLYIADPSGPSQEAGER